MRLFSFLSRVRVDEELEGVLRRPRNVARIVAAIVILVAMLVLTAPQFHAQLVSFEKGRPISQTVEAKFAFDVEDPELRAEQIQVVLAKVPKIYAYDPNVPTAIIEDLKAIVRLTERFERDNEGKPRSQRAGYDQLSREVLEEIHVDFSSATLRTLAGEIRSPRFLKAMSDVFQQLYRNTVIVKPTYADDWETRMVSVASLSGPPPPSKELDPSRTLVYPVEVKIRLRSDFLPRFYPLAGTPNERSLFDGLNELAMGLAQPNLTYQAKETKAERQRALASIVPPHRHFNKGMLILRAGDVPSESQLRVLTEYNERIRTYHFLRYIGYLIVTLGLFAFLALYARRFRPMLRFRTSSIVLIGLPLLVVLFVGRVAIILLGDRYAQVGYLFPAPLLGMLGVILLDTEVAILLVLIGSVLIGFATDMNFQFMIPALFGGLAAVGSAYRLRQRGQLFRAAIHIGAVNILAIGVLRFIEEPTQLYYEAVAWGAMNALLCYLLATGIVPLLESVFGITTDLKLLELTGGHHPLLMELEEKAPGSYQHSLNVAKLAEAAADAIGANYLLVRAGAYFHDIGKTLKPRYFSENEITPDERHTHDKLTPFMSCLIIRNHVKEGIELARRAGLPERVIEFIPQHHGTCLIKYFYYEAVRQYEESESAEPVRQGDFRYPGPKPQSIEAAIVMLADSVEAIATSRLTRPNIDADDIRRLVNDAIQDKFSDGQFDDCHLTLRQLYEIRESMVRTLLGRFHHRVDYPKAPAAVTARKPVREATAA